MYWKGCSIHDASNDCGLGPTTLKRMSSLLDKSWALVVQLTYHALRGLDQELTSTFSLNFSFCVPTCEQHCLGAVQSVVTRLEPEWTETHSLGSIPGSLGVVYFCQVVSSG